MITILLDEADHRDRLREFLKKNEVETRPTFYPVHKMPMYNKTGVVLPVAESLGKRGINLPSYPELNKNDVEYISSKIRLFFENV
jgi:perosamine synthetase